MPLDASDIQILLRALALQVNERPGWEHVSRTIAQKLGGDPAEIMFVEFWELIEDKECLSG